MSPFSLEVAGQYVAEATRKLIRCPMNEQARRSEIRDLSKLVAVCYLEQKKTDWTKGTN